MTIQLADSDGSEQGKKRRSEREKGHRDWAVTKEYDIFNPKAALAQVCNLLTRARQYV